MNSLEKFPISYEYNETHADVKKLFRDIKKYQSKQLSTIRKLAKSGTPLTDIAKQYKNISTKSNSDSEKKIMELQNFDGMSKRNLLETMTPIQLRELRVELLIKLSEAESDVHLINSILEVKGYE